MRARKRDARFGAKDGWGKPIRQLPLDKWITLYLTEYRLPWKTKPRAVAIIDGDPLRHRVILNDDNTIGGEQNGNSIPEGIWYQ